MAQLPPIYDLMVLLATSAEDERRARILADVEQTIADGGGTVELKQEWGVRRLAFEIDHTADAEYHLLQFSGPPALVETLSYNLKITDGVAAPPDHQGHAGHPAAAGADAAGARRRRDGEAEPEPAAAGAEA